MKHLGASNPASLGIAVIRYAVTSHIVAQDEFFWQRIDIPEPAYIDAYKNGVFIGYRLGECGMFLLHLALYDCIKIWLSGETVYKRIGMHARPHVKWYACENSKNEHVPAYVEAGVGGRQ
jgi:hypothetical protein